MCRGTTVFLVFILGTTQCINTLKEERFTVHLDLCYVIGHGTLITLTFQSCNSLIAGLENPTTSQCSKVDYTIICTYEQCMRIRSTIAQSMMSSQPPMYVPYMSSQALYTFSYQPNSTSYPNPTHLILFISLFQGAKLTKCTCVRTDSVWVCASGAQVHGAQ